MVTNTLRLSHAVFAPAWQKREKLNNYTRRLQSNGEGWSSGSKVQVVDYGLFLSGEQHNDFVHDVIIIRCNFESIVVATVGFLPMCITEHTLNYWNVKVW